MQIPEFSISAIPSILFGAGSLRQVPALARPFGSKALVLTGARSFPTTTAWTLLHQGLAEQGMVHLHAVVDSEPSPKFADEIAARFRNAGIDVVIGIGGGSVLDTAKAVAGLLRIRNSVMDFLEGVGPELPYPGPAVPFIAVPTTAGTGSEATKNAVLSQQGEGGFKKSFRHEKLVPRYAVIDPDLLETCPQPLIAANGMDALTQLLESYVSTRAHPFTDALALSGLVAVRDSLLPWYAGEGDQAIHRSAMAYAALLSGITLAQVGLGSVHGLAAPLGAFFPIPHGVACGTLVAACTEANIRLLIERELPSAALARYAQAGRVMANNMQLSDAAAQEALVALLWSWTEQLELPLLSHYGMTTGDISRVVANCRGSSMKTNPILLADDDVAYILRLRL